MGKSNTVENASSIPLVQLASASKTSATIAPAGWKPFALSALYLVLLITISGLFIAVIEVVVQTAGPHYSLVRQSGANGGTFLGWANFARNYLPTILSVLYNLLWTFADYETRRLEPYFQMSKPHGRGAAAADSIHLDYTATNTLLSPFVSFRKRHWAVCGTSVAVVVASLAVTPLVGSLLAVQAITISDFSHSFQTMGTLETFGLSPHSIDFTFPAFATTFLNASIPEMMTDTFAIAPIQSLDVDPIDGERWTFPSTMYSATLECTEALLLNLSGPSFNVTPGAATSYVGDGKSWLADFPQPISNQQTYSFSNYGPWVYNVNTSASLYSASTFDPSEGQPTPIVSSNTFYFEMEQISSAPLPNDVEYRDPFNVQAAFCTPSYWLTPANVTILWNSGRGTIVSWLMTSSRRQLDLNTTAFTNFWANGHFDLAHLGQEFYETPLTSIPVPAGYFNQTPIYLGEESEIHTGYFSGGAYLNNIVPWAFAAAKSDYLALMNDNDPAFNVTFNATVNSLFAFAMHSLLQDQNSFPRSHNVTGTREYTDLALVINPILARLLEGALGVLLICGSVVLYWTRPRRQHSNLRSNPDSLGATMSLVSDSDGLQAHVGALDSSDVKGYSTIGSFLGNGVAFSLIAERDGSVRLRTSQTDRNNQTSVVVAKDTDSDNELLVDAFEERRKTFTRPKVLHVSAGLIAALLFAALLAYGSFLYSSSSANNGLDPVTDNQFAFQLLFSYLPTLLGTVMAPFWGTIATYLTMVAPLSMLVNKKHSSRRTLSSKVSAIPSEVALPRILRMRHWRLAAVSACLVLSSVLAVVLSTLFNEGYVHVDQVASFVRTPTTAFTSTFEYGQESALNGYGPFYAVYSQLALGLNASAWTDDNYFFRPFQLQDQDGPSNDSDRYTSTTLGIGADLVCQPLPFTINAPQSEEVGYVSGFALRAGLYWDASLTLVLSNNGSTLDSSGEFNDNDTSSNPNVCSGSTGQIMLNVSADLTTPQPHLKAAFVWPNWNIEGYYSEFAQNECPYFLPFGVFNAAIAPNGTGNYTAGAVESQSLSCKAVVKHGLFDVTASPSGDVESATLIGNLAIVEQDSPLATWMNNITSSIQVANGWLPGGGATDNVQVALDFRPFESYAATNWALVLAGTNESSSLNTANWKGGSVPSASDLEAEISAIFRKVYLQYALQDQRNTVQLMDSLNASTTLMGTTNTIQRRVLVSRGSFIVAAIILCIYILTILAVYMRPMDKGLPFVPTSLGATLAFVYASDALADTKGTSGFTTREREKHLRRLGNQYYLGWTEPGVNLPRRYGLHRSVNR